jgi:hypothetical protein
MGQLRALLAASFICLLTVTAVAQNQTLQLGNPIERQLAGGETHTYTLTLEENTYVQVVIEQRGIDVVVRVFSTANKSLGEYDTPNGDNGPENVSFTATEAGTYRITVTPLNQDQPTAVASGRYQIKLVEMRPATEQELKTSKSREEVKAKGVALLGEIDGLIAEVRSPQTRIRAQLHAAQLLWDIDEKRASKYLNDALTGVKDYVAALDAGAPEYFAEYASMTQLRFEIVNFVASRDPDAALNFLVASKLPGAPNGNEREQLAQEQALELLLANSILTKDPKRALQLARQNLKKGLSTNLINTVSMLRPKNPELATELANEIAAKVLNEKLLKNQEAAGLSISLLHLCGTGKKRIANPSLAVEAMEPLLSDDTCRDLFQKSFQEALSYKQPALNQYSPERDAAWSILNGLRTFGPELDTFMAGASASVENKLSEITGPVNPYATVLQQFQTKMENGNPDSALESIQKVPDAIKEQLYVQLANAAVAKGDAARARQIINDNISNAQQRRQALDSIEQQEMFAAMQRGKVEEALAAIAALKTPRERANMLTQIARQIGPGQKRSSALALLEQARSMLAPGAQAQDQYQMNALLELARAFSSYDSKRAFDIVDPLVEQVNDLCAAARTLAGFAGDYYENEELDLQNGGGVANVALQVSSALGTLAITNFEHAKATSDRLRQPEVRLCAYLEIAQQTIQGPNSSQASVGYGMGYGSNR